jgi:hypothetical protein
MIETLTFNRSDWSGREVSIKVDRKAQTFQFAGYSFRWEESSDSAEYPDDLVFGIFKVFGDAWGDEHPVIKATKLTWTNNPKWSDKLWTAGDMGISREDADPLIACVQVLCNTL